MSLLLKDPEAVLDYEVDWGAAYLAEGEMLAGSAWSVVPDEPAGLQIAASDFDDRYATVKASGGLAGHLYRLVNRVTTGSGRSDERSFVIRVENR